MSQLKDPKPLRLLSLCSGIGGIELGLSLAGLSDTIVPAQFVEINEFCGRVLAKNFPGVPLHNDIFGFHATPGQFDIISGGFPCQPHSLAGKQQGSEDRRDLFPEVLRLIKEVRPKAILLENVPGLRHTESGDFFKRVVGEIAECGYIVEWGHTTAAGVGAVHKRKRIWILAYTSDFRRNPSGSAIATQARTNGTPDSASPSVEATWSQIKSRLCKRNDGISSRLAGCLMRFDNLEDWLDRCSDNEKKPLRKEQLMALGNAVVPHQVAAVWARLAGKLELY